MSSHDEHDTEDDVPQVLTFRLQASILAEEDVHELHLPARTIYGTEETTLPASRAENEGLLVGENGKSLKSVSVRAEVTGQNHVFSRDGDDDNNGTSGQKWQFVGSSKSNRRIVIQSSKELKDLGIKARNRLEEEKTKRPEIQILDRMPTKDPEKKVSRKATTKFSAKVASNKTFASTDASSRKRKLNSTTARLKVPQPRSAKKSRRTGSHASSWAPDVSHIQLPDTDELSATVKLHGLPKHCTTEQVKKFFAGLQLQQSSILLPNNTTIPQLDASNPAPSGHDRGKRCRLRVLAHFESVSAAILASERSGETIRMMQHDDSSADEEEFVLAVTVLPAQLASALALVTVPAIPRTPFETTLKDITTQQLHPMVDKVLWSIVARRALLPNNGSSVPIDRSIQKAEVVLPQHEEDALWEESSETRTCWYSHSAGYRRFAKHYNRLVDIQDELLHQVPYPIVESSSPSSFLGPPSGSAGDDKDPVVRLTTEACKALSGELDTIEGLLYRARVSHLYFGSNK